MTARQVWEGMLTELSKVNAPSMLLEDFNYFINKAINQYINKRYNIYDINQQTTDDLRVLKATAILDVNESKKANTAIGQLSDLGAGLSKLFAGTYETTLPSDYLHILNCSCEFTGKNKCGKYTTYYPANKINTNEWAQVKRNYYLKPSVENPYFYIMNLDDPVDVAASAVVNGVTLTGRSNKEDKQKYAGNDIRYGNAVQPVMRIVYGDDNSHKLNKVYVDYLRTPIYYSLSEDEIDAVEDNSQVIEFPDDVVYRIIDRVVNLILENNSNPRIQTHHAVNQSVV